MHNQANAPADGLVVASGYGLKIYVQRGHLIVEDGIGADRRTNRLSRAKSGLRRLVVIGRTGFITLEALQWVKNIGAALVQIGPDGEVVAITAAERQNNTKLRRAQVLAADNGRGLEAMRNIITTKLERQIALLDRVEDRLADVEIFNYGTRDPAPVVIARRLEAISTAQTLDEIRSHEAVAGRWYWHQLAHIPIRFDTTARRAVPDHWHHGGPRTSALSGMKSSRKAASPLHALINYAYAILETEATIVLQAYGFDPALGILHTDKRYRGSLAADLMEACRPAADEAVIELITGRELHRGDVYETPEGVCRLGPGLAAELAGHHADFRKALSPQAAHLAVMLVEVGGSHARPPGRRRDRTIVGKGSRRAVSPRG
jgi:CRISPR-associated endonuclease Cas1